MDHNSPFEANYMKQLSLKYGDNKQDDGRPMYDDPIPNQSANELSASSEDSVHDVVDLKGDRVDAHLRIYQVGKLLEKNDYLSPNERRSLVSRRNTAKLRQRQKNERNYAKLIREELDII